MRATRAAMFAAVCVALAAVGHSYMSGHDLPFGVLLAAFGVIVVLGWPATGRRRGPLAIGGGLLAAQGALHLLFARTESAGAAAAVYGPQHGTRAMDGVHAMRGMHSAHGMHPMADPRGLPVDGAGAAAPAGRMAGDTAGDTAAAVSAAIGGGMPDGAAGAMTGDLAGATAGGLAEAAGTMAGMAGHGTLGMLAAHAVAALFCAFWLAWGESAVFRLARALRALGVLAARPLLRALVLVRAAVPAPAGPARRPRTLPRPRRLRGAVPAHALVRRGPPAPWAFRTTAPGRPACA
ncbi:hypothetical protein [Streptomyces sp. NBC_00239]|uniref:hypothetical protein n=1 Tax=Streptomyces sp. NBC_00239 TaxID=2903640 RepID=UPI002E2C8DC8|nr:hypothetical protein [Streptomyces sp. NBC_00239]